jgi:hypothetical protein
LKLMAQQLIRIPNDSGLVRHGLERCDLSSQPIDLFRPAGLMRLLAILGALRSVPHRLQFALQSLDAARFQRRRQSHALLGQEPIDSSHAAAGAETRFQRPPHGRARRQGFVDREFPNHGSDFSVADSRRMHCGSVSYKRKAFRFKTPWNRESHQMGFVGGPFLRYISVKSSHYLA